MLIPIGKDAVVTKQDGATIIETGDIRLIDMNDMKYHLDNLPPDEKPEGDAPS